MALKSKPCKGIDAALAALGDLTPLSSDCGVLCEKACCRGNENEGMRLFPDEQTALPKNAENERLCVCNGHCDRSTRPLACRIFPLFPVIDEYGNISVEADARAYRLCPLVQSCGNVRFDKAFVTAVRRVGRAVSKTAEGLDFLREASAEIATYKKLYGISTKISKRK